MTGAAEYDAPQPMLPTAYGLEAATHKGLHWLNARRFKKVGDYMSEKENGVKAPNPTVFLSYALQDEATAQLLALRLQDAGVDVWSDTDINIGSSWTLTIQNKLRASDYIIVLVSSAGVQSRYWMNEAITSKSLQEFSDRSITVVPVLLDDVEMPPYLRDIQYIDFRSKPRDAVDELVSLLRSTSGIDFSRLSPKQFEDLIADLFIDMGLNVEREIYAHDFMFDYKIIYKNRDPFGAITKETWLVEAKHYSSGRLSVSTIKDFAARAYRAPNISEHIALVTSSQITSAAREVLRNLPIRVVEGVELKRLLITRKDLVNRYFGAQPL
ncbi:TIR domain-containing protein [Methylobacterium tarhaniae]|uniref:TIR domain-containing protein n=1 Tax=Methylobacterium tarhaniae TaxID=1187852 RepID=UPI003D076D33